MPARGKFAVKQASVHPATVKLPGTLTPVGRTRAFTESLETVVHNSFRTGSRQEDSLVAPQGLPEADGGDGGGRGWRRNTVPVDTQPVCVSAQPRIRNSQRGKPGSPSTHFQRHRSPSHFRCTRSCSPRVSHWRHRWRSRYRTLK